MNCNKRYVTIGYLAVRSQADITMCLKQNSKIKKWKEQTLNKSRWQDYGDDYRIASQDFIHSIMA